MQNVKFEAVPVGPVCASGEVSLSSTRTSDVLTTGATATVRQGFFRIDGTDRAPSASNYMNEAKPTRDVGREQGVKQ